MSSPGPPARLPPEAIEAWSYLAVGLTVTILRTYLRVSQVGIKKLQANDYLAWVAAIFYIAETTAAYYVGAVAHGFANNGMSDRARQSLSLDNSEYHMSVSTLEVFPEKPMRIGLVALFSGSIFIIFCAVFRTTLMLMDPINGAQTAGSWSVRETFVVVITTNFPVVFPLFVSWFKSIFGAVSSSASSVDKSSKQSSRNLHRFGGSLRDIDHRGVAPAPNPIASFMFNGSEEGMVDEIAVQ
ncbi:hypothetical protein F5Y01DRAFT_326768 [Xylaria sp. FL0043]|nr:hypothetical protein F5Y01DRAFT_326768 [Xylaria sp. FL0043]